MPFEKAKRTLDKATPGVEKIKFTMMDYGALNRTFSEIRELVEQRDLETAEDRVGTLREAFGAIVERGALSSETTNMIDRQITFLENALENKDALVAVDVLSEILYLLDVAMPKDIARYARAPNAVGLGRTVTK